MYPFETFRVRTFRSLLLKLPRQLYGTVRRRPVGELSILAENGHLALSPLKDTPGKGVKTRYF